MTAGIGSQEPPTGSPPTATGAERRAERNRSKRSDHTMNDTAWERFWPKVNPHGDCWEWTGALSTDGYGRFYYNGKNSLAHRVVWELLIEPINPDYEVDHLCKNRPCVNPDHLEPVPPEVNRARQELIGASKPNRLKTHCKSGHPFNEANTIWRKTGQRACRTCERRRTRESRARKKATIG